MKTFKWHLELRTLRAALLLGLGLALQSVEKAAGSEAASITENTIAIMTFNLRYASHTPPNSWPERRPVMRQCIQQIAPDLIGTQEGLYAQLKDLASDLPEHTWIGLGRDGGSRGEFMAVFYRKNRFEPIEFDHFWLSDTPNVIGSSTWGNSNRRMVTWVKFLDRQTQLQFYFFNTHLDHQIQTAREKSAVLIRERIAGLNTELPIILVGDFNAAAQENKVYELLVNEETELADTWLTASERRGQGVGTFNSFKGPTPGGSRIDWILSRGPVNVSASQIVTFNSNGQYPSDHFPVVAWINLNAKAK